MRNMCLGIGPLILALAYSGLVSAADGSADIGTYLHPRAHIEKCPEDRRVAGALTAEQVLVKAIEIFLENGVQRLCICEVRWIQAPVSGYLVDARGDLEMKITHGSLGEEGRYSLFRLGLADRPQGDGPRSSRQAGEEFAFVAKGVGPDGRPKWYPPAALTDLVAERLKGDPRAESEFKLPLVYFVKYFRDRERFASLAERFAPCGVKTE